MSLDLLAKLFLLPCVQIAIELVEYVLQPCRIKPRRLPQLSGGGLKEGMGIERIALYMLGRLNIETKSRTNKRTASFGIGIGRQHPAFVAAVAKDIHQAVQAELDVGVFEVEQGLGCQREWVMSSRRQSLRRKGRRWRG